MKKFFSKKIVRSSIVNIFIYFVFMLLFTPVFINKSDNVMQIIADSTFGNGGSSHILFSNIVLGKVYKILYSITSNFAWYALVQQLFVFASLTVLLFYIYEFNVGKIERILVYIFIIILSYEGYIRITYFSTAVIVGSVSILLSVFAMERNRKTALCSSIILFFFCVLLSSKVACFILIIGLVYSLIHLCVKHKMKTYRMVILYFGICFFILATLHVIDILSYKSTIVRQQALKYRNAFEKIYTLGYSSLDDEEHDIDEDEIYEYNAMISGLFFAEESSLRSLAEETDNTRNISFDTFVEYAKDIPIYIFKNPIFYIFLFMFLSCIIYSTERRWILIIPIVILFILLTYAVYIMYLLQTPCVINSILIVMMLYMLIDITFLKIDNTNQDVFTLSVLVLFFIVFSNFSQYYLFNNDKVVFSDEMPDEIKTDYLMFDLLSHMDGYSAYYTYSKGVFDRDNIIYANAIFSISDGFERNDNMKLFEKELANNWREQIADNGYLSIPKDQWMNTNYNRKNNKIEVEINYMDHYDSIILYSWSKKDQSDIRAEKVDVASNGIAYTELDVDTYTGNQWVRLILYGEYNGDTKTITSIDVLLK